MKRTELQQVMNRAWQLKRHYDLMYENMADFAECLKMAWAELVRTPQFVERAHKGVVWFNYLKVDGSVRRACGTLKAELLPPMQSSNQTRRAENVQVYYDIEKQAFRCFRKENLINIE